MLLSVPSIKTISRSLTLVVLQISALHGVRMLPELQRILVEVSLTGHMLCQNLNVSISYVMFFKYCNTLYLLLFPLKQFAGLYLFKF